jgi:glycosyltransferase involved in cell wall biosynthesis
VSGEVPLLSVVIPVRNAAATVEAQLAAVCAQEVDAPFEVVVVDNDSTDRTADVVREIAGREPAVRLVDGPREPNRSAARNLGAATAQGAVLLFCDADDVVQPGWMAALHKAVEAGADAVGGALVRARHSGDGDAPVITTTYRGLRCIGTSNCAIRREMFERVGGFDVRFHHRVDVELSCRLHLAGATIVDEPAALVEYIRRPDLRREVRQHFWWAVADARLLRTYRRRLPLAYSWRNSVKHWLLVGPRLLVATARQRDIGPAVLTAAELAGRLAGSVRYRTWAI